MEEKEKDAFWKELSDDVMKGLEEDVERHRKAGTLGKRVKMGASEDVKWQLEHED